MVCEGCQSKLSKGVVPDKWKDGATNSVASGGVTAGKTNKALAGKKKTAAASWVPSERRCRICKSKVMPQMNFCNDCAHKKGICAMCGKRTVDVSQHKMSLT
jgi:hypothetical protein